VALPRTVPAQRRGRHPHATKMLIDLVKEVEKKAGVVAPPPEPRRLAAADKEVVQLFVARLRSQIMQEIEEVKTAALPE
jgi:hypothetical protein